MTPRRAAILGLGLMGGSLGLALRALRDPPRVGGYDIRADVGRRAAERGAIDAVSGRPEEAVADADLVLLAVPPGSVRDLLGAVSPALRGDAVVADLSSVMGPLEIWRAAHPALAPRVVSSHPLCGSEQDGIEAARADLYRDQAVLLGSGPAGRDAGERVAEVWREVGARPRPIDPGAHDALLALTSHLPYLGSVALVRALGRSGRSPATLAEAAGPGLRDMSRLAGSLPSLWEEILTLNARQILPALQLLEGELAALRALLEAEAPELHAALASARSFRDRLSR
ncbi:MAG TPA: prephenate dehydrogenase/arogenate dehydrogenase family protein [Candidatus Eisenbacteria bacterium]